MATKAELEAELASLKEKLAERASEPPASADSSPVSQTGAKIKETLQDYGIETDDLGDIGETLTQSLTDLQKNQPLIALALAFALGFVAGRASK